ncbi:hypothetical protein GVAV_003526 [Gurleya vavrai]
MLNFFIKISIVRCITIYYNKDDPDFTIYENVLERQMCRGLFEPIGGYNCTFKVKIHKSKNEKFYFVADKMSLEEETYFTFNVLHPEMLKIVFTPVQIDPNQKFIPGNIKYKFNTDIDTFDLSVVEEKFKKPAILGLEQLSKLTHKVALISEERIEKFNHVFLLHTKLMRLVIILSICGLLSVTFMSVLEYRKSKKFFKQKKII